MKEYKADKIRNIAIIGAGGVGKTSIIESILFNQQLNDRQGSVDNGNAMTDYFPDELNRKMTIYTKIVPVEFRDYKINFMITPGYPDFVAGVYSALGAADAVIMVIDANNGVEVQTDNLWKLIKNKKIGKIMLINKLDKERAKLKTALDSIKNKLKVSYAPITYPLGEGTDLNGIIDILEQKTYQYNKGRKGRSDDIPDNLKSDIENIKISLDEAVAETDETLMEKYFEEGTLSKEDILKGLSSGTKTGDIIPLLSVSGLNNIGLDYLLEVIVDYMPNPTENKDIKAVKLEDNSEIDIEIDESKPFKAHIFHTLYEEHLGELSFFKVYTGSIGSGTDVRNISNNEKEKVGQIITMVGKKKNDAPIMYAGDIGAFLKLKNTHTNDTLSGQDDGIIIKPIDYPKPKKFLAIHPENKKDIEKISSTLKDLLLIDPSFSMEISQEFNETVVGGLGDLQLKLIIDNLKIKQKINLETKTPRIPYRETIKKVATAQGKYKKQSGGRGQYGDCWLEIKPFSEKEFEFIDAIVGGVIPGRYIPAVEKGVKDAMLKGVLAGYPMINVSVKCFDGSYHEVDSSDMAFQIAASMGFQQACQDAGMTLLEPIYELEIVVPEDYTGDIISDLNSRRGRVMGMEVKLGEQHIKANLPLAEMHTYATDLRSLTQGYGSFSYEFSTYEEVPYELQEKIIAESKRLDEEDK